MTKKEINLIQSSWAHLRKVKPEIVADAFYSKLFLDNTSLRKMFPTELPAQYEKLILTLNIIVARLEKLDELTEDIQALASRHKDYGVQPEHYDMVGNALIWTLKTGISHDWNDETERAWLKCYSIISQTMLQELS